MPLVDENPNELLGQRFAPLNPDEQTLEPGFVGEPTTGEVFKAAFEVENTLGSIFADEREFAYENRDRYVNPDFDPMDIPPGYQDYVDDFMYAQNETERSQIILQIDKERANRELLNQAGGLGMVSQVAAGVFDPINFIPVGGQASKILKSGGNILKRGVQVGMTAGAAATVAEVALDQSQITRTYGENAANIAGATFLGGLIGSAATVISGKDIESIAKVTEKAMDIDVDFPTEAISRQINESTVGALQVPQTTIQQETLKGAFGLEKITKKLSPNLRLLQSPVKKSREWSQQLMENALYMNKNTEELNSAIAVETRLNVWQGEWGGSINHANDQFKLFKQSEVGKGISRTGFNEEVGRAMRRGDVSAIPEVQSTAQNYRKLFDTLKDDAINEGLLPEDVDVTTAASYFTRVYNKDKILSNMDEWRSSLDDWARSVVQREKGKFVTEQTGELNKLLKQFQSDDISKSSAALKKLNETFNLRMVAKNIDAIENAASKEIANLARIDFDDVSDEYIDNIIDSITDKITGTPSDSLPFKIVVAERGALKDRTFNISDYAIENFLENDVENISSRYVRQMSSDIEITKKFGDPSMESILGNKTKGIKGELAEEYKKLLDEANKITDEKKRLSETQKIRKNERKDRRDLEAVRDILRGTYRDQGANPDSVWRKAALLSRTVQFASKLGGVVLASVGDVFRPTMVHGFMKSYGDILPSLITNLDSVKLSKADAKEAGLIWETVFNSRVASISEMVDPFSHNSSFERLINNSSKTFSKFTGMTFWNDTMKAFSSITSQNRLLDIVNRKIAGEAINKSDSQLIRFLGFDDDLVNRVGQQFKAHGKKEGKIWVANLANWTDDATIRDYKAILQKDVNRLIVTPGAGDIPLALRTEIGKTIFQFQSFNIASTQRVLLAGLQQRDAASLNGIGFMMVGGMMSYYLKQVAAGKKLSDNPKTWAFEGLDRSGLLGVFMEVNNRWEKLGGYGMSQAAGAERASRFQSRNSAGAWLGPSFGTLSDVLSVTSGIARGDADKNTIRAIRRILPFQNLFYTRKLFDKLEENIVDKVER